jgi:hypothetical protein
MPPSADNGPAARFLTRTLEVVGAGAALVGWVALLGAAREWATFRAAGIPSPAPTAALLPRASLIGDGLTALAPILLAGLILAGVAYLTVHLALHGMVGHRRRKFLRQRAHRLRPYAWLLLLVSVSVLLGLSVRFHSNPSRVIAWILLVTLVASVGLLFLITSDLWSPHPGRAAAAAFAGVALIGGALGFWWEASNPNPKFDSALVLRRGGRSPVSGFFLTRVGGDVYIAVRPSPDPRTKFVPRQFDVMTIPSDEVELVILGPAYKLSHGDLVKHQPPSPPVTPAPVPQPRQVTVTVPTPPPAGPAPVIGVEALDELKSHGTAFAFPVSSPAQAEDYSVVATAAVPPRLVTLATTPRSPFRVAPNQPVVVHVIPDVAVRRALRAGSVHVSLLVAATANNQTAQARYTVCLEPGSGEDERVGVHLPRGCP